MKEYKWKWRNSQKANVWNQPNWPFLSKWHRENTEVLLHDHAAELAPLSTQKLPRHKQECASILKYSQDTRMALTQDTPPETFTHQEYIFCASIARLNSLYEITPSLFVSNS